MEPYKETDIKIERKMIENKDEDIFKTEEIKIEEMAIDGICGVY